MYENKKTSKGLHKRFVFRCLTMLLVTAILLQSAVIGVFASAQADYIPGTGQNSILSGSAGAIGKLESDRITEQMREEILASIKKDLLQRVEDYEMTGHVGVILTFSDKSLITSYASSKYASKMTYEEFKSSDVAATITDELTANQSVVLAELEERGLIYEVKHSYVHMLDGAFVYTTYENLEAICQVEGIERVTVSNRYLPQTAVENPVDVYDTGIFNSSNISYTGKGTIVAILDTGCDYAHSAFTTHQVVDPLYSRDDIAKLMIGTNAYQLSGGTLEAREVYYGNLTGEKIVFGYDYADKDTDIMPFENSHGTHVAGIIAGKDDKITGVAIDAQLAIMKVFSDYEQGAEDGDIIAALEDAIVLGVDAINMSLGTSCGFSSESDPEEVYKNELYGNIEKAGISLIVAASNDFSSGMGGENGNTNKTDNPDSATVGAPSSYPSAFTVASISGKKSNYMLANGDHVVFFRPSVGTNAKEYDFFKMLGIEKGSKVTFEYVTVPGFGLAINYAGLDVKNKIALVQRGDITFEEKVQFAAEAGAIAVLVYNNVYGDITMTIGNNAKIPAVSIGKDDGEMLASRESGTFEFDLDNVAGPFMSDFSSWGPTPDLKLKPEITAHGGNIVSAVVGGEYDEMSGTSMAAPNMCGITVLIRQYVKERYPDYTPAQVRDLVNQLCMSTATIALDNKGNPYSPRKQGAGIADILKATTTPAYLFVEGTGKTKLELGDDPLRKGVYTMTLSLANISDATQSYRVGNITMTESVSTSDPEYVAEIAHILSNSSSYSVEGGTLDGDIVTVEPGKTAKVTITLTLSQEDKSYLNSTFENGMFIEGYITFDNTAEKGVDLNAPFLAFYGNWGDAPIFDLDYYEVETEAHNNAIDDDDKIKADYYATTPLGTYYYDYIIPLGTYLYEMDESEYSPIPATREHAAISYFQTSISGIYGVFAGLLRGAKELSVQIVDCSTGQVVWEMMEYNCPKAHYYGAPRPYVSKFNLDALSSKDGNTYIPFGSNNAKFEVTLSAKLDWEGGENKSDSYSFSFYIDYEPPTVTDAIFRTEYDKAREENRYYIDVMIYDNHYAMACRPILVYNIDNNHIANKKTFSSLTEHPIPIYQENRGEATKVTIELTDYLDIIKRSSTPNGVTLYVEDYAMNAGVYYIPFPETDNQDMEFAENELTLDINQTFDLNTFFVRKDSAEAVMPDYLETLKWTSSDPSVVAIKDGKIEALKSGKATIKVTADTWYERVPKGDSYLNVPLYKTIVINVTENVMTDDPNSGKNALIEDLFFSSYYTVNAFTYYIDPSGIGLTGSTNYFDGNYSIECYPSEQIRLSYELKPWNLSEERYELTWTSSNPSVATVDENGLVTAESEGRARITLQIKIDGKTSLLAARLSVEVKSEFIIENRTLVAYKGKGGDVVIPDDEGILYIGAFAFSHFILDNKKEVEKDENGYYDLDDKKTPIGNNTVTSVVIPEDVETIEKYAFYNCTKLQNVTLPSTCKTIGAYAFEKCTALENINLDRVKIVANRAFYNCTSLTCEDLGGAKTEGIYAIGDYGFANTNLKEVTLTTLSRIGKGVFEGCKQLTKVELGQRTRVSKGMFKNCTALKEITIYSDTVDDEAFSGCSALEKVVIQNDMTYLGKSAFAKCTKLSSVTFNGQLEQIASMAFTGCTKLKELTLPNGRVAIDDQAFEKSGLNKVTFAPNTELSSVGSSIFNPSNTITIELSNSTIYKQEGGAIYTKDGKTLVLVLPTTNTAFEVPATVTTIGDGAFSLANRLLTVTFAPGSALQHIGDHAFAGCTVLTTVTLPNRDITIGDYAFYRASKLANIDLSRVSAVGSYAFYGTALTKVELKTAGVTIGAYAFSATNSLTAAVIGKDAVIGECAFMNATKLAGVTLDGDAVIGMGAFRNCISLVTFDFEDVTGVLGDEAFLGCERLQAVVAPKLTGIGNKTFSNCLNLSVLQADALISIGDDAFVATKTGATQATALKKLELPLLESVGINAFYGSVWLETIHLPALHTMGDRAFALCHRMTSATFSEQLKEIPNQAFENCVNLTNFDFSHVEKIGAVAFFNVPFDENLVLENVTYLGDMAFAESDNHRLKTLTAPKLTYVGAQAFAGCTKLKAFTAPMVEEIGDAAFYNTALVEFEIGANLKKIGMNVFDSSKKLEAFYSVVDDKKVYDVVYEHAMIAEGVLYTQGNNGFVLAYYPSAKADEQFTVADGTVRIEFGALMGNQHLKKITLSSQMTNIGNFAFYGCDNLETVVFKSYYAPTLEGTMSGEIPKLTPETVPDFPGFEQLYKYDYEYIIGGELLYPFYYSNFKAGIGSQGAQGMTAVLPDNCEGYDSLLYTTYFTVATEETSGATAGKYAIAFMQAVSKLPQNIDRFDRVLMEAAINAYNALEGHADEKVFVDSSYTERFLSLRSAYNVNVVYAKIAALFDMDATKYSFELVKDANAAYLALTEDERAMVENAQVLTAKISELSAAIGRDVDFSLSYEEHFDQGVQGPGPGDETPGGLDTWVVVLIISASVVALAGATVVTTLLIRKKKSSTI